MRECGMLLPISSLPSPYGIGAFSKEAYEFVDTLQSAGQKYWQILPLGPTSYGDSPYQSFSAFAGNPYFIDLTALIEEELLTEEECEEADFGDSLTYISYDKMYENRFPLLHKAYKRWMEKMGPEKAEACFAEKLMPETKEYCFYMALKNHFDSEPWISWEEGIKLRWSDKMEWYRWELKEDIQFYEFQQYKFQEQWEKLKAYANAHDIRIIGDIPIYVAFDSADAWAHPELFQFDRDNLPSAVAGCPPDGFSATGQLWGNPLYRWDYHRQTGFAWWMKRMEYSFRLYDVVRVDHFRGFDEYYSIPYGSETAEHGHWEKGPGIEIFRKMEEHFGTKKLPIIAEDLGFLTQSVLDLVKETGFPGMKVLEFAFDTREESDYLPHNYPKNCVVYTGTHDNDTIRGWFEKMPEPDKLLALEYINGRHGEGPWVNWDFIRLALASVANLAVIPVQDYIGLGSEARINEPSTLGNNWKWRMKKGELSDEICQKARRMARLYGRF
ncbi:MAG: 4-alpha-glucanotransferase [Lachnospiraceae bacterium]|nr:4-alpha-glucanotransferase [Lachnospiraceae bacterium]